MEAPTCDVCPGEHCGFANQGVNINRLEIDKTAAFRDRRIAFRAEGVGIGHH